jgi:two-component system chemotaxis response regulator CheB
MEKRPINVLVVEDSPVVQLLLKHVLDADPQLHVMGTAADGCAALEFLQHDKPDVILMDVHMPKMDGFDTTRRIMETQPLPIIICSATMKREEVSTTFRALDAGAVAVVDKPVGPGNPGFEQMVAELIQNIKLMAEVKVVKRWGRKLRPAVQPTLAPLTTSIKLIAMGASTGGPPVLRTILAGLPNDLPVPVLIVQHIAMGFLDGMVEWLNQSACLPVRIARPNDAILPGCVYIGPDGFHLGVSSTGAVVLSAEPPENGLRPAVAHLFRSVARVYGANAAGVLLTGMGCDGAAELKLMKDAGAVTIAQNAETSVVHGMPGEAIKLGAATYVLSPEEIAVTLTTLARRR